MHNKKLYGTATVGTKGQIVIPSEARAELHISEGDRLYVIGSPTKGVIGLLKEGMLEEFIEHMNIQIENFKTIKKDMNSKGNK